MSNNEQVATDSVGQRIRALRLENKMTQAEFAAPLGLSRSTIAQWEGGRAGQVQEHLERISKVFGTSLAFLISGEDGTLQGDERALIKLYRACGKGDQQILLRTARSLAKC